MSDGKLTLPPYDPRHDSIKPGTGLPMWPYVVSFAVGVILIAGISICAVLSDGPDRRCLQSHDEVEVWQRQGRLQREARIVCDRWEDASR